MTALQEIKWCPKPHTFLVGNHDASRKDLLFNSVNSLKNLNFKIIESVSLNNLNSECDFLYIPYLQDDVRKSIKDYKEEFRLTENNKKLVVFSHNDIQCSYGFYKNDSGLSINDIETNCTLFLNGHIHNNYKFCNNGINIGNLTGQNFNENAFIYRHGCYLLEISDTGNITLEFLENPFCFNFYQLHIVNEKDYSLLDNLKCNSVVSIKCKDSLIEKLKLLIKDNPKIIESRIICDKTLEGDKNKISLNSLSEINHIEELEKFILNQLGSDEDVKEELNKIRNN